MTYTSKHVTHGVVYWISDYRHFKVHRTEVMTQGMTGDDTGDDIRL